MEGMGNPERRAETEIENLFSITETTMFENGENVTYSVFTEPSGENTDRGFGYSKKNGPIHLFQIQAEGKTVEGVKSLKNLQLEDEDLMRFLIEEGEELRKKLLEKAGEEKFKDFEKEIKVDNQKYFMTYIPNLILFPNINPYTNFLKRIKNREKDN